MYTYSIWQWILLFFTYSFGGWIWEIIYLSLKNMHLVLDKGILFGPLRTMYGSGALILILFVMPLKENFLQSYISGMLGATLLEFIVGFSFEKIFHRKCWDYSNMRLNISGHICLPASLLWGLFTVVFIRYLHPIIHTWIISIPMEIARTAAVIFILMFATDIYFSIAKMVYAG